MPVAVKKLTAGSVDALQRLIKGDTILKERNRSKTTWKKNGETLHHLTFKNLLLHDALTKTTADKVDVYSISPAGRKLAKG